MSFKPLSLKYLSDSGSYNRSFGTRSRQWVGADRHCTGQLIVGQQSDKVVVQPTAWGMPPQVAEMHQLKGKIYATHFPCSFHMCTSVHKNFSFSYPGVGAQNQSFSQNFKNITKIFFYILSNTVKSFFEELYMCLMKQDE